MLEKSVESKRGGKFQNLDLNTINELTEDLQILNCEDNYEEPD